MTVNNNSWNKFNKVGVIGGKNLYKPRIKYLTLAHISRGFNLFAEKRMQEHSVGSMYS